MLIIAFREIAFGTASTATVANGELKTDMRKDSTNDANSLDQR